MPPRCATPRQRGMAFFFPLPPAALYQGKTFFRELHRNSHYFLGKTAEELAPT